MKQLSLSCLISLYRLGILSNYTFVCILILRLIEIYLVCGRCLLFDGYQWHYPLKL